MKVLHVIPSVSLVHGGPSRAIVDIEQALVARGIEVTTVTTNDDGNDRTLAVACGAAIPTDGATRWYFPRNSVFYKVSVPLALWLKEHMASFDAVHVHALFSFAPVAAAMIARRAGIPYVVRPLGVLNRYGMTKRRPLFKQASFSVIERPLIEAASAVHFTSGAEQREAESLNLRCRAAVIPLGVDIAAPTTDSARDEHKDDGEGAKLLFLSRLDRKKNIEGLLRALARLAPSHPGLTLDVAGDGNAEYLVALKSLAADVHVADRVRWHGHVSGKAKASLFAGATAFVLPSFSENFGIAAVEALAAGLPCIVSREVAVHEEVDRAGAGVVVGTDPESIAAGIEALVVDRSGHPRRRAAALRLAAQEFSCPAMGERLEALYRSIAFPSEFDAAAE
jgi:glycosyltransferase involved in cell wall biosynthesis